MPVSIPTCLWWIIEREVVLIRFAAGGGCQAAYQAGPQTPCQKEALICTAPSYLKSSRMGFVVFGEERARRSG